MQPNTLSKRQVQQLEELQTKMQAEIQNLIVTEKLPEAYVHPGFASWLTFALPHETTVTMNIGYPDYKRLKKLLQTKPINEYNLQEMGIAINSVESKSQVQLECTDEDYFRLQDAVAVMAIKWNEHMESLKKPIIERYTALSGRVQANKTILMPNPTIIT